MTHPSKKKQKKKEKRQTATKITTNVERFEIYIYINIFFELVDATHEKKKQARAACEGGIADSHFYYPHLVTGWG